MRTILRTRSLKGCPLNTPFTDIDELMQKVTHVLTVRLTAFHFIEYYLILSYLILFYLISYNRSSNYLVFYFLASSSDSNDIRILGNIPHHTTPRHTTQMKMLCVHKAQHQDVQFVVAVRAFPAVNNIISLWIFLGLLETKS